MLSGMVLSPFSFSPFMSGLGQTVTEMCCFAMSLSEMVRMEGAMDALILEFVQPLLISIDHNHKPFISHQEGVAKQMHVLVFLNNYYCWKQRLQLLFLSLETFYKIFVLTNETLLSYLEKTVSLSQNLSGR